MKAPSTQLLREWGLKLAGLIALGCLLGPVPGMLRHVSPQPRILGRFETDYFVFGVLYLLAVTAWASVNVVLWISYRRGQAKTWLEHTEHLRQRLLITDLAIAVLWIGLWGFWRLVDLDTGGWSLPGVHAGTTAAAVAVSVMIVMLREPPAHGPNGRATLAQPLQCLAKAASNWLASFDSLPSLSKDTILVLPFIALFVAAVFARGLTNVALIGDQSLSVYASQTIAAGNGPQGGYVLLQPPLAYLPGAIAIVLGRIVNLPDVISIRCGFLVIASFSIALTYLVGRNLSGRRVVGVLGAAAFGWVQMVSLVAKGGKPQAITAFIGLLMALAIQERYWVWAGVAAGCLSATWPGALVVAPVAFAAALLQDETPRFRTVARAGLGFSAGWLVLAVYLAGKGTLVQVWQQIGLGTYEYLLHKLTGTGLYHHGTGFSSVASRVVTQLLESDLIILNLGIVGLAVCLFYAWRKSGKPWAALSVPRYSGVVLSSLLLGIGALFDFQGPNDLAPMIPCLAILSGWIIWRLIEVWICPLEKLHNSRVGILYVLALVIFLSVLRFQALASKTAHEKLQAQRLASEWLDTTLGADEPIQAFGDLWPLVLSHRTNATRMVHLGPKALTAMAAEGQTFEGFVRQLDEEHPSLVLLSRINAAEEGYLDPLLNWLDANYDPIGQYLRSTVYASPGDSEAYLAGLGMIYAYDKPLLVQADELAAQGKIDEAATLYQRAADEQRSEAEPLIFLGDLYRISGARDQASQAYEAATSRDVGNTWAYLALGNDYHAAGKDEDALEAYLMVYPVPEAIAFSWATAPALVAPSELRDLAHPLGAEVGDHLLVGYDIHAVSVAPGETAELALYWWAPSGSASSGTVGIRWLTDEGNILGPESWADTLWDPGYATRWAYEVPVPADARRGGSLQVQVRMIPRSNPHSPWATRAKTARGVIFAIVPVRSYQ